MSTVWKMLPGEMSHKSLLTGREAMTNQTIDCIKAQYGESVSFVGGH